MQQQPNLQLFRRPGKGRPGEVITNMPSGVLYPSLVGSRATNFIPGAPPSFVQGYDIQRGLDNYPLALIDSSIPRRGETVVDPELTALRTRLLKEREDFDWYVNQGPEIQQRSKAVAALSPGNFLPVYWEQKPTRGYNPYISCSEPLYNGKVLNIPPGTVYRESQSPAVGGSLFGTLASSVASSGLGTLASSGIKSIVKGGLGGLFKSGAKAALTSASSQVGNALMQKGISAIKGAAGQAGQQLKDAAKETAKATGNQLLEAGKNRLKTAVQSKTQQMMERAGISEEARKRVEASLEKSLDNRLQMGEASLKRLGTNAVNQMGSQLPQVSLPAIVKPKRKRKSTARYQTRGGSIQKKKSVSKKKPRKVKVPASVLFSY